MAKHAAYGGILQYFNVSFLACAAIVEISGPSYSADTIDITTHDSASGYREYLKGLRDAGEVTLELAFDPSDATLGHFTLLADFDAATSRLYRIIFASDAADIWEFTAFVTGFEPSQPLDGKITASVTMKITGITNRAAV